MASSAFNFPRRWLPAVACVGMLLFPLLAAGAPPTTGSILKQSTTPLPPLPAPRAVIELPQPGQQSLSSSVTLDVKGITIEGNQLIPSTDLMPLVAGFIGHVERLSDLDSGITRITDFYHAHGYPLAYAYLPAQTISNGVVHINVVEPRYDQVTIQGQGRFRHAQAARTLGLQSGEPVAQAPLERGLLLLNQTPGVRVAGTLVPGTKSGTTSLEATVSDTPLATASLSVDNYGNDNIGHVRTLAAVSLNDPFGYGGQIAANALRTSGGLLNAKGLSLLSHDIHSGLRLGAYGSRTTYTLGGKFTALGETGVANQYGIDATLPLVLAPGRIVQARLDLLHNQFSQASQQTGTGNGSQIDLARFTLNGSWADAHGVTTAGVIVTGGNKRIASADGRTTDAAGPHTAGHFWTGQVEAQRTQTLPRGFQLQMSLSGQLASRNLDGSQQFYLGGPQGVMSYAVGDAGGDTGALARVGLYHDLPLPYPNSLTLGVLLQSGKVWRNHSAYPGSEVPNQLRISGAGLGLNYHYGDWLAFELDYVHRLGNTAATVSPNHNGEVWASLQVNLGN